MVAKKELTPSDSTVLEVIPGSTQQQQKRFYDNENNYRKLRQERDDMPDVRHNWLVDYLKQVLEWMVAQYDWVVMREFNLYETYEYGERPLYPDLMLFKRAVELDKSYHVRVDGPAPEVIFEIFSESTGKKDIGPLDTDKPHRYQEWGVLEYFVYDPRKVDVEIQRLWGWRLVNDQYEVIPTEPDGRMWSEQLDSWLVPKGEQMELQDIEGRVRLTGQQAERQAKEFELQAKEIAQRQADAEKRRAEQEAFRAQQAEQQAQFASQQAEAALRRIELLEQQLREAGKNPDDIK